jgi:hypothetical protein
MKGGSPVGVASHGQYWRGWVGDDSWGETWFVIYKPQDEPPVELVSWVSASTAYSACTNHNAGISG